MFLLGFDWPAPFGRRLAAFVLASLLWSVAMAPNPLRANEQDRAYLHGELDRILEYRTTDEELRWNNPSTGNSGTVRIGPLMFLESGAPCRRYLWKALDQEGSLFFHGEACRDGGGKWKLTEDSTPRALEDSGPADDDSGAEAELRDVAAFKPPTRPASLIAGFDEEDEPYLGELLEKVLEYEQTGKTVLWNSPATGRSGSVTVRRTFFYGSKVPCRAYRLEQKDSTGRRDIAVEGTACRNILGDWGAGGAGHAAGAQVGAGDPAVPDYGFLHERRQTAPSCGEEDNARAEGGSDLRSGKQQSAALDLVFVIDTTGSMGRDKGDVRLDVWRTVQVLRRVTPDLKVGIVAFKDRGDEYLIRRFSLAPMTDDSQKQLQSFLMQMRMGGGGDEHEPVDLALDAAVAMPWRADVPGRIVVVGDGPARRDGVSNALEAARRFHGDAPLGARQRRVSAVFTGGTGFGREFYDGLAHSGGGSFVDRQARLLECVLLSVVPPRLGRP